MELPDHYKKKGKASLEVCLLLQSMAGLKPSGSTWYKELTKFMVSIKLERSVADPCVFYNLEISLIVGLYVDDLVVAVANDPIEGRKCEAPYREAISSITWVGCMTRPDVAHAAAHLS